MSYKSIIPAADGWFFIQTSTQQMKEMNRTTPIICRVAAWALQENGRAIGFVGGFHDADGGALGLVPPNPAIDGVYKHISNFYRWELEALAASEEDYRSSVAATAATAAL